MYKKNFPCVALCGSFGTFINHYTIGYEESFGRKIARFQRGQHRGKILKL
jgi:hypothetical protein